MKRLFLLIIVCSSYVAAQTDSRFFNEPNPEELLPEFVDISKIKSAEISHYITNPSGDFLKYENHKTTLFVNNFPTYTVYKMDPITKDTLQNKSVYTYYEDSKKLKSYKEYRVGESTQNFYNEEGQILKKENYFNGNLENTIFWEYDNSGNIVDQKKVSYWKNQPKNTLNSKFTYNAKNQLSERNRFNDTLFVDKTLWFYNDAGNVLKEITYNVDSQYFAVDNTYDSNNNLLTRREFRNDKLSNTIDYTSTLKNEIQNKRNQEKSAEFYKRKTKKELDSKGNWIKSSFLNDEKLSESDVVDGNLRITERVIIYK